MAHILIVDDNRNLRLLYQQELSDEGNCVSLAASGKAALELIRTNRPDVVLLDIQMPDMDGLELLEKIVAFDRTILVILNSAHAAYAENYMTWCADAYCLKSGDLSELKRKIKELLAARGARYPLALAAS